MQGVNPWNASCFFATGGVVGLFRSARPTADPQTSGHFGAPGWQESAAPFRPAAVRQPFAEVRSPLRGARPTQACGVNELSAGLLARRTVCCVHLRFHCQ